MNHPWRAPAAWLSPLVALALAACDTTEARNPAPTALPAALVATAAVESRALPAELEVTGTLMADAQSEVAAEQDGQVVRVLVERGALVEMGAVLAELGREDAQSRLHEAEAMEGETRARLGLVEGAAFDAAETPEARRAAVVLGRTEADYQRYARLVEEGAVSRSEYDAKRAEAQAAREQYQDDESQFEVTIRAPEGTTVEQTELIASRVAREIGQVSDVTYTIVTVGGDERRTANLGTVFVKLVPVEQRKETQYQLMDAVRTRVLGRFADLGLRTSVSQVAAISGGGFVNKEVAVFVSGPDLKKLGEYADRLTGPLTPADGPF